MEKITLQKIMYSLNDLKVIELMALEFKVRKLIREAKENGGI